MRWTRHKIEGYLSSLAQAIGSNSTLGPYPFPVTPLQSILASSSKLEEALPVLRKKNSVSPELFSAFLQNVGHWPKNSNPLVLCVFVTKGGVLKSTLSLNLARTLALHGLKTLVIGLDLQGDISSTLETQDKNSDDFHEVLLKLEQTQGLADFYFHKVKLQSLIQQTDLPHLFFIPETPELVNLDQALVSKVRREYFLKEQVLEPLKSEFDVILLDCPPSWNLLNTNALVGADIVVSPLECKVNNFRNLKMFHRFIDDFKQDLRVNFQHAYVATKLNPQRKLSVDIFDWYKKNLTQLLPSTLRECQIGEEAMALKVSLPEYSPHSPVCIEYLSAMTQIWNLCLNLSTTDRSLSKSSREESLYGTEFR